MMDGNLEPSLPDKLWPGTKRSLQDRSATSRTQGRLKLTVKNEHGLVSSHTTDSRVPSAPLDDRDGRRYPEGDGDDDFHVEKRSRTSDWPLRCTPTGNEAPFIPRVALGDRYNTLNSASPPCCTSEKPRSSKFVEGSMGDRASQTPHPSYIGDAEQPREQFEAEQNLYGDTRTRMQLNGPMHHKNRSVVLSVANDKSGVSRPSSIFRFGRSVAAAFNPSSWKIWSKQQEEGTREKAILRERHEKAEKIYKELKRSGQLRGSTYETHLGTQDKSKKHDSGVALEYRSPTIDPASGIGSRTVENMIEEKRYGRIFLDPLNIGSFMRGESPSSELSAPLRNSSSQDRDSALKRGETPNGPQALRRLPSRKDLQKQQKLVKRVSDLEGKLEAARRQLAEALGEPIPAQTAVIGRSRFSGGTLASLPSQHLLSICTAGKLELGDADTAVAVGRTISIDNGTSSLVPNDEADKPEIKELFNTTSERADKLAFGNTLVGSNIAAERRDVQKVDFQVADDRQVEQAIGDAHYYLGDDLTPRKQTINKRKSIDVGVAEEEGRYRPTTDANDDDSHEASEISIPKRRPGRPRKLQKVDPDPNSLRVEPIDAKHAASRSVMQVNSPRPSNGRNIKSPKDRRVVLSKKVVPLSRNSHILRKGRYSTSPPPLMSSSGITYAEQEVGTGKTAKQDDEGGDAISIVPSADVPPVPEIPRVRGPQQAVLASQKITGSGQETNAYDQVDWGQKRLQTTNTDVKKGRAKSKQAFEWPADVF